VLWTIVDVVYIGMFIYKGLYLTAFNYAVYLVLAVMGFVAWRKSLRSLSSKPREKADDTVSEVRPAEA
jgi:nicotinamide mononucleotide transporter